MNETLTLLLSAIAGVGLGIFFFGGLWWTISRAVTADRPALLFLGSFLARMSFTIAGFYFVSRGSWQRLTACLVGFVVARLLITRLTRSSPEVVHAS